MGGNAFGYVLQPTAFPRIPPKVYQALKARIVPLVEELYVHVGAPHPAPEKVDHGDLDLIVCLPRRHTIPIQSSVEPNIIKTTPGDTPKQAVNVPHDVVAATINAKHINSMDGNHTSNFAVPILMKEWAAYGLSEGEAEEKARKNAGEEGIYYQIDVDVCESKEEWDRHFLFQSYGDLNMIMGLIAKNAGLHLSNKGLKYPDPPNPPLSLSESFDEIFTFFGWSKDEWQSGFETTIAAYKWALSSRFVNLTQFKPHGSGFKKRKPGRMMYAGFIEWAGSLSQESTTIIASSEVPDGREAALDFFKKHSELVDRRTSNKRKDNLKNLKNVFSGTTVRDWTDLGNYWLGVKKIMDGVRERLGGDAKVCEFVNEKGEERLREIVLEVQAELGVWPKSRTEIMEETTEGATAKADAGLAEDVKKLVI